MPSHSLSPVSIFKSDCYKILSFEIELARATPILVSVLVFGQQQKAFDGIRISQVCYTSKNSVNCVLLCVGFGRKFKSLIFSSDKGLVPKLLISHYAVVCFKVSNI